MIDKVDKALRPQKLEEVIGMAGLKEQLEIAIEAAKQRDESLGHTLLASQPGLGKSSIAQVIANELGGEFKQITAGSIESIADILEILTKLKKKSCLFLDEIHSMDKGIEESIYSAMEDNRVDLKLANKEIVSVNIESFTLIGATTKLGKISAPLRNRFEIIYQIEPYSTEEIAQIIKINAEKLKLTSIDEDAILNIANRARGVPRLSNRLLRRARDYAQIKNANNLTNRVVEDAMGLEGIDENGIGKMDAKYMEVLMTSYSGGPVGLQPLSNSSGIDVQTISDYIEPYLLSNGYICRTQRGRTLTKLGMDYANSTRTERQNKQEA